MRVLRAEFRISQAQLAERLGVARQTVHAIENGKFAPSLSLAFKIATLFAADINDVFAPDLDETLPALLEASDAPTRTPDRPIRRDDRARPHVFFSRPRGDDG